MTVVTSKKNKSKEYFYVIITLLFIYLILFEFILPINSFLPKPSLLKESFSSLWSQYNLLQHLALTTTLIYASLIISYLAIEIFSGIFVSLFVNFPGIILLSRIFKFFSPFVMTIILYFWLHNSILSEFIFSTVISLIFMLSILAKEISTIPHYYVESALCLQLNKKELYKKVFWKYSQVEIFSQLRSLHYYLWTFVLLYEYIGKINGIGAVFYLIVEYRDLSALILIGLIVFILIWIGEGIIIIINKRLIFWKKE
ncbi:ABC transporter permease subunit [Melioribacteraceae bacterium 4301-Me]|uniref:ABC transporter permease subunit n=1 Tax=Pyranulibacter aquaticus TaxID=3163344 RepID=UPI003597FBEA